MRLTYLFRQQYLRKYLSIDIQSMSVEQVYCYLMAFMAEVLRNEDEPDLPKLSQSPERDSKKVVKELDETLKEYKKKAAHPSV